MKMTRRCPRPEALALLVLALGTILAVSVYHTTLLVYVTNTQTHKQETLSRPTYFDDVTGEHPEVSKESSFLRCADPEGKGPVQDTLCMVSDVSRSM